MGRMFRWRVRLLAWLFSCAALLLAVLAGLPPGAAHADWREDVGTFRIGILQQAAAFISPVEMVGLKKAYALALGLPVDVVVADDYPALIEAQTSGRVHYAIYSATAYAAASLSCACVVPLVAPTSGNGALGLRAVLLTRSADFTNVNQIAFRRTAFAGLDDLAGLLIPRAELLVAGKPLTGTEPFLVNAASPTAALDMLRSGKVDALFGWVETGVSKAPLAGTGTLASLAQVGIAGSDLKIVWTSSLLRFGPHAVRSDIDPEVRRRLVPFLIGLKESDAEIFDTLETHHLGGFAVVGADDYANAVDIIRNLAK